MLVATTTIVAPVMRFLYRLRPQHEVRSRRTPSSTNIGAPAAVGGGATPGQNTRHVGHNGVGMNSICISSGASTVASPALVSSRKLGCDEEVSFCVYSGTKIAVEYDDGYSSFPSSHIILQWFVLGLFSTPRHDGWLRSQKISLLKIHSIKIVRMLLPEYDDYGSLTVLRYIRRIFSFTVVSLSF